MSSRITKYLIIAFSLVFAVRVLTIFAADRLYNRSLSPMPYRSSLGLIDRAILLDSSNAELYFAAFEVLDEERRAREDIPPDERAFILERELELIERCIDLCPSVPGYHFNYALVMRKVRPAPNVITRKAVLDELKKAYDLKPYSEMYRKTYEDFLEKYSPR